MSWYRVFLEAVLNFTFKISKYYYYYVIELNGDNYNSIAWIYIRID